MRPLDQVLTPDGKWNFTDSQMEALRVFEDFEQKEEIQNAKNQAHDAQTEEHLKQTR
jgi:hypothetical protein